MITDNKKTHHYLVLKSILTDNGYMKPIKSISKLFRDTSSKQNGGVYCFNCLHSFRLSKALKNHQRVCNNHDYCKVVMPEEGKNILKHQFGTKSIEMPHMIYADTETLLIKQHSCSNNPKKSFTEKQAKHQACGYPMTVVKSYDKDIHSFYHGEDCLTKFCDELIDNAEKIANTPQKTLIPLTADEEKKHERSKYCHICNGTFNTSEKR